MYTIVHGAPAAVCTVAVAMLPTVPPVTVSLPPPAVAGGLDDAAGGASDCAVAADVGAAVAPPEGFDRAIGVARTAVGAALLLPPQPVSATIEITPVAIINETFTRRSLWLGPVACVATTARGQGEPEHTTRHDIRVVSPPFLVPRLFEVSPQLRSGVREAS